MLLEQETSMQPHQEEENFLEDPAMFQNTPSTVGSTNFHDNDSLEEDENKQSNNGMKTLF
jgi:hypothetical protein